MAERCQELLEQNTKLNKQVTGKMALQGCWHMIWDKIISQADRFKPYLNFISDQEDSMEMAKKNISIVKGELHKTPVGVAESGVNFLSSLSKEQIHRYDI